eukprot:Selendium_serpulae@DN5562_c0_g1_i1.p1
MWRGGGTVVALVFSLMMAAAVDAHRIRENKSLFSEIMGRPRARNRYRYGSVENNFGNRRRRGARQMLAIPGWHKQSGDDRETQISEAKTKLRSRETEDTPVHRQTTSTDNGPRHEGGDSHEALGRLRHSVRRTKTDVRCSEFNGAASVVAKNVATHLAVALPLSARFEVNPGHISEGHLHESDKICVPQVFLDYIMKNMLEPPWVIELVPVIDEPQLKQFQIDEEEQERTEDDANPQRPPPRYRRVFGSVLDFRSPSGHVFLPDWMFEAMGVRPGGLVLAKLRTEGLPPGGSVALRPQSTDVKELGGRVKAALERELRHYATLTSGTTIHLSFDAHKSPTSEKSNISKYQKTMSSYGPQRRHLVKIDVVSVSPKRDFGDAGDLPPPTVEAVCIQDTDVETAILAPIETSTPQY